MTTDSTSDQTSTTATEDNRQVVDGQGVAVGADSVVNITSVPDESYELSGEVVRILGDVTQQSLAQSQQDSLEIINKLIMYGIPAAAIVFILKR